MKFLPLAISALLFVAKTIAIEVTDSESPCEGILEELLQSAADTASIFVSIEHHLGAALHLSTCNSDFDTYLEIIGAEVAAYEYINDDSCSDGYGESLTIELQRGEYKVSAGAVTSDIDGILRLKVTMNYCRAETSVSYALLVVAIVILSIVFFGCVLGIGISCIAWIQNRQPSFTVVQRNNSESDLECESVCQKAVDSIEFPCYSENTGCVYFDQCLTTH